MRSEAIKLIRALPAGGALLRSAKTLLQRYRFERDYADFHQLNRRASARFLLNWRDRHPCLEDATSSTGFDRHYVYHPAWAARCLAQTKPKVHVDISSSLHFAALVSAFVSVEFYDYRPADLELTDLKCRRADLLALPFADRTTESLSCMHVVEHIGLGRYGDPLDPDGDVKAMAQLQRVIAPSGSLFFVVPVGTPRLCFNAHRVYSYAQIVAGFPELDLHEFTLIRELSGPPIQNATPEQADHESYGCGCFWFRRLR